MGEQNEIVVGAINVVATPHPSGVYVRILQKAADHEIRIWGRDYAKITRPEARKNDDNIYCGRILVWTEITKDGPWLDKKKNDEASEEEKKKIQIPPQLEPNFRSFNYALNVSKHKIIIEYENDFRERFGPTRAEKLFSRLFSTEILGADAPDVTVTVIPEEGLIERILGIPKLRRLEIYIERPNPDDLGDDAAQILGNLKDQGAKSQEIIYAKAPSIKSLKPSRETRTIANVAAQNGYVVGKGKDKHGNPIEESTKDHPKRVRLTLQKGQSALAKFLSSISLF